MQFELTKEFLNEISEAIASGNSSFVAKKISDLHEADIAEILDEVNYEEAKFIYYLLDTKKASDVLVELEEDVRERFLEALTIEEIAKQLVDNVDSDDAANVIAELPDEKKQRIISHIEHDKQAQDIIDLLAYPEDSAGGLMAKELISVNANWTAARCIRDMRRQSKEIANIYTVYVVDDNNVLLGILSLKRLLFSTESPKTLIKDIFNDNVIAVEANLPAEEAANMMQKYDLVVIPVVDKDHKLLGRITIDDAMDVIQEEAEKDYAMASGISEKVESSDSVWILSRARLPWLLIGLVGELINAHFIGSFEDKLRIFPIMVSFIPLILAMGGNVGVQSSAIIVQALARNSLGFESTFRKLLKEFGVSLFNGIICSTIVFVFAYFTQSDLNLAITISVSLTTVFIYAAQFGTIVPLVLNKFKIDPAVATGPFITTMNDITGMILYFCVGWLFYF